MWENQSLFLPAVFISGMVCMSVWWAEKAFTDADAGLDTVFFGYMITAWLSCMKR